MKIIDESFTIVLLGNWNKYILEPNWLAKEIFEVEAVQVEFAINVGLPPRITSSNIRIIPSDETVVLVSLDTSNECLTKMESLAAKLLDKLQHTPVRAFGINFGFEEEANAELLRLFDFNDNDKLSNFNCEIKNNSIQRKLIVNDSILNLNVRQRDDKIKFNFNFNYDVSNASDAKEKMNAKIIRNKKTAENLLNSVYELSYDLIEESE